MSHPAGPAVPVRPPRPGSDGEHRLQQRLGTATRADRFYDEQVCDRLLPTMVEFLARMRMVFVATADARGACDSSVRVGSPGFVTVLDDRTLALPAAHGPAVATSLDNITENPHVGLLLVDFVDDLIGLHVNGRARLVDGAAIHVTVEEAYIHCRKHIPRLAPGRDARSATAPEDEAPSRG